MEVSIVICRYRKSSVFCLSEAYQTTQNLTPLHFKTSLLHSINPQKITQFPNTVGAYYMQLYVGVEFLFPLA